MRILITSLDPVERSTLQALLSQYGHEVVCAEGGEMAWRLLNAHDAPLLALLDWRLEGLSAPLLCRKLRDRPDAPYVYLILTGRPAGDMTLDAAELGADDVLPDPLDRETLSLRLRAAQHILALQSNLLQSRQALEYKSTHDALTGVWNRAEALGLLEREIARSHRDGSNVSIIMVDLDHFKHVNDEYGHLAGDAALREVSRRLVGAIRPYDAIGRFGGEEFVVVLSGCSAVNAERLAERLRAVVADEAVHVGEASLPLTISAGVAVWNPLECCDLQALIRAADAALYRAKRGGRNRVEVAWEDTPQVSGTRRGGRAA